MFDMKSYTISYYGMLNTFHTKYMNKSYMIPHIYNVIYDFIRYASPVLLGPVQIRPRASSKAAPIRFKCIPLLFPYVCLSSLASKSSCSGLLLQ